MKRRALLVFALVLVLLGSIWAIVSWRRAGAPAPDISALTESLKKTASEKLSAPVLANEQIALNAAPDQLEVRAKEVIDAAIQAGGTAIKTNEKDGTVLLLVKIPGRNAELFRGLIKGARSPNGPAPRDGETRLVEITIHP